MMVEFDQMAAASVQVRAMCQDFIDRSAQGGPEAVLMRWDYYRFVVGTTIAGLHASFSALEVDPHGER